MKMKSFIKIMSAVALAAAACLAVNRVSAQTVLAGWDVSGLTASGPSPWAPTTANANLTIGGLTKGAGVTNTTTGTVWGGNSWTNAGVADSEIQASNGNKYVYFTITPNVGYTVSITNISKFYVTKSATGPASGELQYSTNGTDFTDVTPLAYGVQGTSITRQNIGPVNLSAVPGLQNLNSNFTATIRIVNWGASGFSGTWYIGDGNASGSDFEVQGAIVSAGVPPHITGISPSSVTTNAGQTVAFTVTATGDLASNYWYKVVGSATNLISSATTATLTLANVLGGDTASYFVVLSNATPPMATSSVVTLTVVDPIIAAQPSSAYGLLDGTAQFAVTAVGTSPGYRWYFSDTSGNIVAPVINGAQGSGSVISGANASTLTISNLQFIDPTNFVVVVTNNYGAVTSSVASLLSVANTAILAFWDFSGNEFTNISQNPNCVYNPVPYLGAGSAQAVGTPNNPGNIFTLPSSPFAATTSADPADGPGFDQIIPGVGHLPNFSWGLTHYPLTGGNKTNGVQFLVSTVGAKNIRLSYDSRASATASNYERVQYTTNGTDWIDFPSSSTFGGIAGTGSGGWLSFSNDLTGFPGAANNPNFGLRIVTEFQSTATYGIGTTNGYVGTANDYSSGGSGGFAAGTLTYDLVGVFGDAITNNNTPPTIASFVNTNMVDTNNITLSFTVGDLETPATALTVSASSLNPSKVNPTFNFGGAGASRTLNISFSSGNYIPDPMDAAPILFTVTDTNGDSTATWFLLTVSSINLPPTNSLTALVATNILANSPVTIPFKVGDDHTLVSGLTYATNSNNNTLIPNTNIIVNGIGTANPSVTITPAANQLGVAVVSVTVNDNDANEPRGTTANIAVMVRPNTNVVAIDYFNYDNSGALDTVGAGFWQHLSGLYRQLQVGSGAATIDTPNNTENLQTPLLGAPYRTNSGAVLYASYIVNMDPLKMPLVNGTYFTVFNDGSGVTGPYECRVVAATNDAAPGSYRLGIANFGADSTAAQMVPRDLLPNSNYVVVTALVLSNGFSTLWVNPSSQTSPSVTDTTPAPAATNLYNISDFELRESGGAGGSIRMSYLKVGTTFDSVFPSLHIQSAGTNAIVNWSDPTLGIQSATNVAGPYTDMSPATPPYTNNARANNAKFFRFKR